MMNAKHILVDYDCLQDTRLGLLNYHNPDEAIYYLRNYKEWHERIVDESRTFNRETFALLYKEREDHPEEFLAVPMTSIILIIQKLLDAHARDTNARFYNSKIGLKINIYPYLFSEEVKDLLRRTIFSHLINVPLLDIDFVRMAPEDLTPDLLVRDYLFYYCYSIDDFLAAQIENLTKLAIPNISVISPKLFLNYNPEKDAEKLAELETKIGEKDIFEFISKELAPLINIEFIDVSFFSFLPVPTAEEYALIKESIPKT